MVSNKPEAEFTSENFTSPLESNCNTNGEECSEQKK